MLVDGKGRLKITDFGLARLVADEPQWALTRSGQVMGTPQYAAPEALRGEPPDPRMDVYSLGAVLYELVSGQPPIGDFASLEPPLDAIVRRALAPEPARRFASMDEMRHALEDAVVAGTAPRERSAERSAELRHWERAAALLLTLSTSVVLWAVLLSITPRVLPPAEVAPLVMGPTERLADGRLVSRARFETGPALAAMAAVAAGLATLAHLRDRWRDVGAGIPARDQAIRASRRVLIIGVAANLVAALRRILAAHGYIALALYTPLLGGIMEAVALFFFWSAVLEARRRGRPLAREFTLLTGATLCLVPPVLELVSYLSSWRP
jgi:serine/threonine-protein kinase